ncbi:MAG: YXWGXW repeat-containing protein [Bryobacterales bacterium]|nr:YXWGXW repeat-containing protein [Bryobacterales bacterium]
MEKVTVSDGLLRKLFVGYLPYGGNYVKTIIITFALVASSLLAGSIGVGITIGPPPPPRVLAAPPAPGPGYVWVDGYWYPVGHQYRWHSGYWTRAPYEGAAWVRPRYESGRYYNGYWEGSHGRIEHNHHWDRDRRRDYDRH